MNTTRKQIQEFWQEVERTLDQLLEFRNDVRFESDSLMRSYRESLQKIDRNLTFHFERENDESAVEMVFGCDGYPESIHSVLSLVGEAPQLSGIEFRAFNNRYDPVPTYVNLGDELCEIDEFWFALKQVDSKLQLTVYMKDLPRQFDMDPRIEAVMILLDALIGEYELMTRVWALDWCELPVDPVDFNLQPLSRLRDAFDDIKSEVEPVGITLH